MLQAQVYIVGMRPGSLEISERALAILETAEVVVGGKLLLAALALLSTLERPINPPRQIPISGPLSEVLTKVRSCLHRRVVVLADGDPLFYGFGRRLVEALGADAVTILPNITTLQLAAARLRLPWHDIETVSLHGRNDFMPLFAALVRCTKVAVFTDATNTPAAIAQALLQKGAMGFTMTVLEDLDTSQERIRTLAPEEVWDLEFSALNLVLVQREYPPEHALGLGIPDHLYMHENNLITKQAVRAAGLSMLHILPHHTVWDLGAGCGSVAIEASHLACRGRVFAVEKHRRRVSMIKENLRRFGAYLVEVVRGEMPNSLQDLPTPDCIFIGGGLGTSKEDAEHIMDIATDRLKHGGRLVLHCILLETLLRAKTYLETRGWVFGITQLQASTSDRLAGDLRFQAQNPVFILWAEKP
ncbi:MAG: precorrin-6y C5,15-methyltransferase (decarboxylating) subunit CbiE [Proteobacteria bacterium]|nr:precorrin-6y C5,15-methyltransferase (decarboxylating) subunit CbiE [Pseudomonadota bacterium]